MIDLPNQDYNVILNLTTKIFFCKNKNCKTNTFSEEFEFIEGRSRITKRLNERIVETAKEKHPNTYEEIIYNTLADISEDTILRLIKKTTLIIDKTKITKTCIDDFALRKRHNYGTVMINIETYQIIDIIESRQEEYIKKWLKTYPNIEIISRNGGIMYKSACEKARTSARKYIR